MISHTFLWGICQSALATIQKAEAEEKEGREGREGRKLLECCVCSYNILCDATDDITARHRLATLGRPYVRNTNGTDREDATTEKNREREMLQAYARKIYDDMADKFESRLVEKLGEFQLKEAISLYYWSLI